MPEYWYAGIDWECSSGPIIDRMFRHVDELDPTCAANNDLWPIGTDSEEDGAGDKDILADGDHPAVAIGPKTNRPNNLTGVVMSFNAVTGIAVVNVADKFVSKHEVANVLTWNDSGEPATWNTSINIGEPVYIDDTAALAAGCNLSFSPLNGNANLDPNPLFGYVHYHQTEYRKPGTHITPGFPDGTDRWPITTAGSGVVYVELCVMQVNDSGQSRALKIEAWEHA